METRELALCRQHSKRKASTVTDTDGWQVWCGGGSDPHSSGFPLGLLGHLPWSTSGGLFQGIDHLLEDVRAVVGYLLEDGVGELLQLGVVPFHFLQLALKLKGRRGRVRKVQILCIEWEFIRKEITSRADVPVSKGMFKMHTFLGSLPQRKAPRSQL